MRYPSVVELLLLLLLEEDEDVEGGPAHAKDRHSPASTGVIAREFAPLMSLTTTNALDSRQYMAT